MNADAETDLIAVLYAADQATKERNGAHMGKVFFADERPPSAFNLIGNLFFQGEHLQASDIESFYAGFLKLIDEGKSFIIRASLAHKGKFLRRIKDARGKCPPGLKRSKLHLLVLDLDDWPNVDRLDPRVDSAAAWRWIVDKLGPEFANLRMVCQWSSSACMGAPSGTAPDILDGKIFVWMDRPLGEQSARDLLKRLDARVKAYYATRGISFPIMGNHQEKRAVDPKVADAIQPIYIVPPTCNGFTDPLAGIERAVMLPGSRSTVSVEDLWTNLPSLAAGRVAVAEKVEDETGKKVRAPKVKAGRHVPGEVIPFGPALLEIEAIRKLERARGAQAVLEGCANVYHVRVALEQTALAVMRGGYQEGARDEGALRIASALVASMPLGRDVEWVRAQVRTLLNLACGSEWVRIEWEGAGADASVISNYVRACRGEPGRRGRKDPRYTYSKARLLDELQPTRDEILALGLRSLCSDADLAWADREIRREKDNTPCRVRWIFEARRLAPEVHRLRADGLAWRAIAATLEAPVANVMRMGKLTPAEVAAVQEYLDAEQRERDIEIADAMAQGHTQPEDLVAALLDGGVRDADVIAERTGLPVELVVDIMQDFGVEPEEQVAVAECLLRVA